MRSTISVSQASQVRERSASPSAASYRCSDRRLFQQLTIMQRQVATNGAASRSPSSFKPVEGSSLPHGSCPEADPECGIRRRWGHRHACGKPLTKKRRRTGGRPRLKFAERHYAGNAEARHLARHVNLIRKSKPRGSLFGGLDRAAAIRGACRRPIRIELIIAIAEPWRPSGVNNDHI